MLEAVQFQSLMKSLLGRKDGERSMKRKWAQKGKELRGKEEESRERERERERGKEEEEEERESEEKRKEKREDKRKRRKREKGKTAVDRTAKTNSVYNIRRRRQGS